MQHTLKYYFPIAARSNGPSQTFSRCLWFCPLEKVKQTFTQPMLKIRLLGHPYQFAHVFPEGKGKAVFEIVNIFTTKMTPDFTKIVMNQGLKSNKNLVF